MPFPFRQYSQLFEATQVAKSDDLGKLTRDEASRSIAPFCHCSIEMGIIMEHLGFDREEVTEVNIRPKCQHDYLYDSGSHSSEEIAKMILCRLSLD
jgi:hypothetical protein